MPIGFTLMFLRALEILWRTIKYGVSDNTVAEAVEAEAAAMGMDVSEHLRISDETDLAGVPHKDHGARPPDKPDNTKPDAEGRDGRDKS